MRVARSRAHEETLGGRLSESVQRVVSQGGREGSGMAYALEGERIFAPYSRVESTGWIAVLGIPTSQLDSAAFRSLAAYALGVVLSLALGTLGALWVARTITRPMAEPAFGGGSARPERDPPAAGNRRSRKFATSAPP